MDLVKLLSNQDDNIKRENANINADAPMGIMLKVGSETVKELSLNNFIAPEIAQLHRNGDIHIHDLDFYPITFNCCQINLNYLLKHGFHTGHGYIRSPSNILTASYLTCIVLQSNQNDMYGGQSIPTFEYDLAPYVAKSFIKHLIMLVKFDNERTGDRLYDAHKKLFNKYLEYKTVNCDEFRKYLDPFGVDDGIFKTALKLTERDTYQAMEALIHNLNTMQSRAGAQTPFSSINYGTGTTWEQRLVIKAVLNATDAGLGNHETPIFPVQVFKVKDGINTKEGDPNYDLLQLACKVTAKRLFPNFSFLDASYNIDKYKPGKPETELAVMGCRTRVFENHVGDEIVTGRGNLSFTTINLPRLAIEYKEDFYAALCLLMCKVEKQLLNRFELIAKKKVYNFPFLMGQGVWLDSEKLNPDDEIREVLKHGSMSIGFIGLAECLTVLTGTHHGESEEAQKMGLEIIGFMRSITNNMSLKTGLNFSLFATPAESLSGRFIKIDREKYGIIDGVTDREYYTNSFHVPVWYEISAYKKLAIEAPYHELCNAGSISYIELNGNCMKNISALQDIVLYMKSLNMNYCSINHPVDRCPVCGYQGIINDVCPKCGRHEGEGVSVEKLKALGVCCGE